MKDRLTWQKEKYSRFWINRVKYYGFDSYCKGLCMLVESKEPSSVFEVGIGTGFPFGINFFQKGIQVTGCDISDILIKEVNRNYPEIRAYVGSYEECNFGEEKYDVVYCFRSTWHFEDIFKALDVMFDMTKSGGSVVFDIMNKDSVFFKLTILKHRLLVPYTLAKNIIKIVVNNLLAKNYLLQNLWDIDEIPVSTFSIDAYLNKRGVAFKRYSINQIEKGHYDTSVKRVCFQSKVVYDCKAV